MLTPISSQKIGKVVLLGLFLTGCATQPLPPVDRVVYKTTPIYGPDRPTLPTLGAHDLDCLPKSVLKTLAERDTLRREYAEKLEIVIKLTQQ
jgi:hypothetical protein